MIPPVFCVKGVFQGMRKLAGVMIFLCVMMFFLTADSAAAAQSKRVEYPAEGVVINTAENDRLNVREKPDAKSQILAKLPNGAPVTVNGEAKSPNGSLWYFIHEEESGILGYVSAKYIELPGQRKPKERRKNYPAEGVVINIAENDRLNIREKPSSKSRILDALDNGAHVTVNGEAKSSGGGIWYYIYDEESGVSGYVSGKYIELQ